MKDMGGAPFCAFYKILSIQLWSHPQIYLKYNTQSKYIDVYKKTCLGVSLYYSPCGSGLELIFQPTVNGLWDKCFKIENVILLSKDQEKKLIENFWTKTWNISFKTKHVHSLICGNHHKENIKLLEETIAMVKCENLLCAHLIRLKDHPNSCYVHSLFSQIYPSLT